MLLPIVRARGHALRHLVDQHEGSGSGTEKGRLKADPAAIESSVLRLLASGVKLKTNHFMIPKEQPMDLVDLHAVFEQLRKKEHKFDRPSQLADRPDDKTVCVQAFQRAFERLFFLLRDSTEFDGSQYDQNGDGGVTWDEFYRVHKQRTIIIRFSIFERLYLLFSHPDTCILAQIVSALILVTIVISSLSFILSTLPECHRTPEHCDSLETMEACCLSIFIVEYLVRVMTVAFTRIELHDKAKLHELVVGEDPIHLPSPLVRLIRYVFMPANIIDLAAILPGIIGELVSADGGAFVVLRLVRLTRIFRAFKSPALVAPVVVIGRTMTQSSKVLYQLVFNLCLGIVIFGALMYLVEGGDDLGAFGVGGVYNASQRVWQRRLPSQWNGEAWVDVWERSPFQSIPGTAWWAIVTSTTVGYGDDYPTTALGMIVALLLMVFSMVILALPVGVMGETFSKEWARFQREKHQKAHAWEKAMAVITRGIKDLDPVNIAPLVLVEVWHDHPIITRSQNGGPAASTFLGQHKLHLSLPCDRQQEGEIKAKLEPNWDLVKRHVTGHILVRYTWTPRNRRPSSMPTFTSGVCAQDFDIQGSLKLSIVSAEGLLNISCDGYKSSPYCTVLLHPSYNNKQGPLACIWRTETVQDNLNPSWDAIETFSFNWNSNREPDESELGESDPDSPKSQLKEAHFSPLHDMEVRDLGGSDDEVDLEHRQQQPMQSEPEPEQPLMLPVLDPPPTVIHRKPFRTPTLVSTVSQEAATSAGIRHAYFTPTNASKSPHSQASHDRPSFARAWSGETYRSEVSERFRKRVERDRERNSSKTMAEATQVLNAVASEMKQYRGETRRLRDKLRAVSKELDDIVLPPLPTEEANGSPHSRERKPSVRSHASNNAWS